jgi:hypothetical protein
MNDIGRNLLVESRYRTGILVIPCNRISHKPPVQLAPFDRRLWSPVYHSLRKKPVTPIGETFRYGPPLDRIGSVQNGRGVGPRPTRETS